MKTSTFKKMHVMLCISMFSFYVSAAITHGSIKGTALPLYGQGTIGGDIGGPVHTPTLDFKVVTIGTKTWGWNKINNSFIDTGQEWTSQLRYWNSSDVKTENNMIYRNGTNDLATEAWTKNTATIPSPVRLSFFHSLMTGGWAETALINYDPTSQNSLVSGDNVAPVIISCVPSIYASGAVTLEFVGSDNQSDLFYYVTGTGIEEVSLGNPLTLSGLDANTLYTVTVTPIDFSGNEGTPITRTFKTMKSVGISNIQNNVGMDYNGIVTHESGGELVSIIQQTDNTLTLGCTNVSSIITNTDWKNHVFNTPEVIVDGIAYPLTIDGAGTTASIIFTNNVGGKLIEPGAVFLVQWSVIWTNNSGHFFTGTFTYTVGAGELDVDPPSVPILTLIGNTVSWPACTDMQSGVKWYEIKETGQPVIRIFDLKESSFSTAMTNGANGIIVTAEDFYGNKSFAELNTLNIFISDSKFVTDLAYTVASNITVLNEGVLSVNTPTVINSVTINPGGKLNLSNPMTVATATFKADKDGASFNTKLDADITATTVRYIKTLDDTKWYFLSFPCDVSVADIKKADGSTLGTLGAAGVWFIKDYDGLQRATNGAVVSNWKHFTGPTLLANHGYIFGLASGTVDVLFPLNTAVVAAETEKNIAVSSYTGGAAGGTNLGWNLIGQPYLSKYKASNAVGSFYINISDGTSTYSQYDKASVPDIDPMTAYFVQASAILETDGIIFALLGRQAAPSIVGTNLAEKVQLTMTSSTGTDNTNLILDNDLSPAYEIGQDLEKWIGTGTSKPQIYTTIGGLNYAFNGLPITSVQNLPIGIYTKLAGTVTINANASQAAGLSKLVLLDKVAGVETDLLISNYNFVATAGTCTSRFVLTAQRVSTGNLVESFDTNEPIFSLINSKLTVNNIADKSTVRVFDTLGRLVASDISQGCYLQIALPTAGIYCIQLKSGNNSWTSKVINQR